VKAICSILLVGFLGAKVPAQTFVSPARVDAQDAPALIELDSKRIAFIEHRGPYWSLGSAIDRVSRDAKAFGVRDALIVRYLGDQLSASPQTLSAQIGFEVTGTDEPKPPYQVAQWPLTQAVRRKVSGTDALSTRHYAVLKAWAAGQGLVPAGDLIARIALAQDGVGAEAGESEIFLPVCVPDAQSAADPPDTVPDNHPLENVEVETPRPPQRIVTRIIPLGVSFEPEETKKPVLPQSALADPLPPTAPHPMPSKSEVPAAGIKAGPDQSSVPIRTWIEQGNYEAVATMLLPEKSEASIQEWSDNFASRVVALANGVQKLSPGQEGWLAELGNHLSSRRIVVRSDSRKNALRIGGSVPALDTHSVERKNLMREVDMLMGQVAHRTLTPDQVRDRLIVILEAVATLTPS